MVSMKVTRTKNHNVINGMSKGSLKAVTELTSALSAQAKSLATGKYSTGALRASIQNEVKGLTGTVSTDLVYARIQEEGGTVTATAKKYLSFVINGKWVRVKSVKIPAKHYLANAAEFVRGKVTAIYGKNIRAEIRNN
jgi:phage gpG-like protein